jgi:uncharacterized membrane protein
MTQQIFNLVMLGGIILIFLGVIFLIISSIFLASQDKRNIKIGVGGFIGPIPFGFFTSGKIFWAWLSLFVIGMAIFVLTKYFLN